MRLDKLLRALLSFAYIFDILKHQSRYNRLGTQQVVLLNAGSELTPDAYVETLDKHYSNAHLDRLDRAAKGLRGLIGLRWSD